METNRKTQVTVRMDEEMTAWIDERVETNIFGSRGHALLYAMSRLMEED